MHMRRGKPKVVQHGSDPQPVPRDFSSDLAPLTAIRAWSQTWDELEALDFSLLDENDEMWDLVKDDFGPVALPGMEDQLEDRNSKLFVRALVEFRAFHVEASRARRDESKYRFLTYLDACNRRLRMARSWLAYLAIDSQSYDRPNPPTGTRLSEHTPSAKRRFRRKLSERKNRKAGP